MRPAASQEQTAEAQSAEERRELVGRWKKQEDERRQTAGNNRAATTPIRIVGLLFPPLVDVAVRKRN